MNDSRPDPDELLERVQNDEQRRSMGRLKIFFGMCAGVGKTYAMLEAARAKKNSGVDVMAGVVVAHSRKETEALAAGFEALPPKEILYRGTSLKEFDLAAAVERRPGLILMDELAHTNVEGSDHTKRWQDVRALLDAGINVYTTLNVQHLESLNDIVAQITGVIVRETVPDAVVEGADEIELIDILPDDLLQRLNEGKVYVSEQAGRAVQNFFRKGNLTALRELALRRTAERVNLQVQDYRAAQSIATTWPTTDRLLVCIGPSPFSARLVRATRRMATGLRASWFAVTVETPTRALSESARQQLERNIRLAEQLGAETVTLEGSDVVSPLIEFARSHNITKIITGKPLQSRWRERLFGSVVDELIRKSGEIDVYIIKGEGTEVEARAPLPAPPPYKWHSYLWSVIAVVVCTFIGQAMHSHFDLSNIIMVYLLAVVFLATCFGRGPSVLATVLGIGAFDFFFVPPRMTLAVTDTQYLVTFGVMLFVGLTIGSLTVRVREHAKAAGLRERRTAALYAMSRDLSHSRGLERLLEIAVGHIAEVFECDMVGLLAGEKNKLAIRAGNAAAMPVDSRERGVAQWAFDTGRPAGLGTDTLPSAEYTHVPLNASHGPLGVLALRPKIGALSGEQLGLLEAFVSQAALAIECDRLTDAAQRAQVAASAEQSRSALLSSVSHDLRTPLAAICGAASTLIDEKTQADEVTRRELAESILEEGERMSRLVTNLLEMTRLEAGPAQLRKELCPIAEVIGSALARMEKILSTHSVALNVPNDLPAVPMDVLLIEQVLANLLENAVKYAPAAPLEIVARKDGTVLTVGILDRGPGLQRGDETRIFEKFTRGPNTIGMRGTGLGLAICKAAIEAHNGAIRAENRSDGGTAFWFTLPIEPKEQKSETAPDGRNG